MWNQGVGGRGEESAGASMCLPLLRLLSELTGKRSIKSFGAFHISLNHSHIANINPKQASDNPAA